MSRRADPTCNNCGEPAFDGGSLPVDDDGNYVAVDDHVTDWGGVPGCTACVALHVAAGARCNEVLREYFRVAEATLAKLEDARESFAKIAATVESTLNQLSQ